MRPGHAALQPLIGLAFDTRQPGLRHAPGLVPAVARSLAGETVTLEALFTRSATTT